jgi:hypothetical protein
MKSLHVYWLVGVVVAGCSASGQHFGDQDSGSDSGPCEDCDGYVPPKYDGGNQFGDGSSDAEGGTSVTTVYANTDDTLYSLNPSTNAVTLIGPFVGNTDAGDDDTVTDLAVNAAGDVYVNTESVIYSATLPSTPPGNVQLTKIASISLASGQRFYALAFAPAGALGTGEVLIGGDGDGELYAINTTNGATQDLGSFGTDPSHSGYNFALSGDLVFYMDATNTPTGLATVRPCKPASTTCMNTSDYLVAVDMTALATAYTSKTPATSVRKGIYGGSYVRWRWHKIRRPVRAGRMARQRVRVRPAGQRKRDAAAHLDRHVGVHRRPGYGAVVGFQLQQRLVRRRRDDGRDGHRPSAAKLTRDEVRSPPHG